MTRVQTPTMSDTQVRSSIDTALDKVAGQLRELNRAVRFHSTRQKTSTAKAIANPYEDRSGPTPNLRTKSTKLTITSATSWKAKASP